MYKETKRAAAVLGGLVLVASGFAVANTAFNSSASAASCYSGAKKYVKIGQQYMYPRYASTKLVTGSACKDINIKPSSTGRYIKVCFYPSSGGVTCQKNYKWAAAGKWTAIATAVKDNTKYRLKFASMAPGSGYYAD